MNDRKHFDLRQSKLLRVGIRLGLSLSLSLAFSLGWISSFPTPARAQTKVAQAMSSLRKSSQRWIEINVSTQRLVAWEGHTPVYAVIISTGTDNHPTLTGAFAVQSKYRVARMQGEDYDIPDVPYTMYFYGSYAIHGAYWHHRFGTPVSHGCVNVAVNHARWLFRWAAVGTPVVVHY